MIRRVVTIGAWVVLVPLWRRWIRARWLRFGAAVLTGLVWLTILSVAIGGGDNAKDSDSALANVSGSPTDQSDVSTPTTRLALTPAPTGSPSPTASPTDAPTSTMTATPMADYASLATELTDEVQRYFDAYNRGDFPRASGYLSDEAVSQCGGALNLAFAFSQLQMFEGLRYELIDLKVNSVDGDTAWADLTFENFDLDSGEPFGRYTIGPYFAREHHIIEGRDVNWVLRVDPLPILPVMVFC